MVIYGCRSVCHCDGKRQLHIEFVSLLDYTAIGVVLYVLNTKHNNIAKDNLTKLPLSLHESY